jgi:hypothetical protein
MASDFSLSFSFVDRLYEALQAFSKSGFRLIGLDGKSKTDIFSFV